jgi:hypothetical protein
MTKSGALTWLFQCNPKRFNLASHLESGVTEGDWSMNQHRDKISPGDRVFFWQSGLPSRRGPSDFARLRASGYRFLGATALLSFSNTK